MEKSKTQNRTKKRREGAAGDENGVFAQVLSNTETKNVKKC